MYEVLQPHILWGFTSPVSLQVIKYIFQSNSQSGIGQLYAEAILISDNIFINSSGSIGGCFSIFSYDNTSIVISNNQFEGIYSPFLNEVENGGVIYLDGSSSLLIKVEIKNNNGRNILCRGLGGFILLKSNSSSSNLTITNLQLEDVYSQQGSAIYVSYSKYVQKPQILSHQNLIVINTQVGYLKFFNKFTEFLVNKKQYIQSIIQLVIIYLQNILIPITNYVSFSIINKNQSQYKIPHVVNKDAQIQKSRQAKSIEFSMNLNFILYIMSQKQETIFASIIFLHKELAQNYIHTLIQNSLFQFNKATQEGGSVFVKGQKNI
ncbi:unnamed protein product [Paramecium octaurelia]|uniref:Uncharacterized protein n=1 Tax=Paramecium octaurelia TaxID=43137 RepID=A0A8S1XDN8_PAROT|nr:unnamed protein product [Paramecium octaurelia]